jgi:hypothetical protein
MMRRVALFVSVICLLTASVAAAQDPGPFAKGRKRVGLYGGLGSNFGQNYGFVGAGAGYYLVDGLEGGLDFETWFGNSPSINKITPQLRYVFWKADPVKPYLGAFWRHTWLGGDWPDYDSWGGRAGVAYRSGRNYFAVGVVHERYINNSAFSDDSDTYPEVSVWIAF